MARTPRTDRASVADAPLTVRFTKAERDALNKAVKLREKELGLGATVTQGTLIRALVRRYCEEQGIPIEEAAAPTSETAAAPRAKKKWAGASGGAPRRVGRT